LFSVDWWSSVGQQKSEDAMCEGLRLLLVVVVVVVDPKDREIHVRLVIQIFHVE